MKSNFVGHRNGPFRGQDRYPQISRDFDGAIECRNLNCPFVDSGNKECGMSSAIKLDNEGRCELYQKHLNKLKEKK